MMGKINNYQKCWIALLLVIIGIVGFILNSAWPLFSDDMIYSYVLTPEACNDFKSGTFIEYKQKLGSVRQIIESQYNHYLMINGRVIVHSFVQMFSGLIGKPIFNVINTIFFLIFIYLVVDVSNKSKRADVFHWLFVIILCWYLLPNPWAFSYIAYGINYLWSAVFYLMFILLFTYISRKTYAGNWYEAICIPIFALFVGTLQEAFSVGIAGAIIVYYVWHRNEFQGIQALYACGFWLGTIILCVAPGNIASHTWSSDVPIWISKIFKALLVFLHLKAFWIFIILVAWKLRSKAAIKKYFVKNQLMINIIFIQILFSLVIGYRNDRQLFFIELCSIILIIKMIYEEYTNTDSFVRIFASIGAITLAAHLVFIIPSAHQSYKRYNKIIEDYTDSKDGVVFTGKDNLNILTKPFVFSFSGLEIDGSYISMYYSGHKKKCSILPVEIKYALDKPDVFFISENKIPGNNNLYKFKGTNFYVARIDDEIKTANSKYIYMFEPITLASDTVPLHVKVQTLLHIKKYPQQSCFIPQKEYIKKYKDKTYLILNNNNLNRDVQRVDIVSPTDYKDASL